MPNWVQTDIYLHGEESDIRKVLELVKSNESEFDFNKIIPMPKTLHLPAGGHDDQSIQYAISKKSNDERMEVKDCLVKTQCSFYGNYFNKVYSRIWTEEELEKCAKEFNADCKAHSFDDTDYKALGIKTFEDLGNAYINNIISYGCDTWYDWCCEHWGTKWNACEVYVGKNSILFQTAWSVADPILEAFAYLCDEYNVTFDGEYADEDRGHNSGHISSDNGITEYDDNSNEALRAYINLWGDSECIGEDENGNLINYDCDTCPNKCYKAGRLLICQTIVIIQCV